MAFKIDVRDVKGRIERIKRRRIDEAGEIKRKK